MRYTALLLLQSNPNMLPEIAQEQAEKLYASEGQKFSSSIVSWKTLLYPTDLKRLHWAVASLMPRSTFHLVLGLTT